MCNTRYMPKRGRLLRRCLAYFLRYGVADLSLRPLAAATGTSARMLVHHFGSKDELIAAVMAQVRKKAQTLLDFPVAKDRRIQASTDVMLPFWKSLTSKTNLPYLRLLFEVQILAIQSPARFKQYLMDTSGTWLRLIEGASPPGRDRVAIATLCTAVIDGLLLELLSTGDVRGTSDALSLFVAQRSGRKRRRRPALARSRKRELAR